MIQQPFDQLAILQVKIEDALEKSDFEELETAAIRDMRCAQREGQREK